MWGRSKKPPKVGAQLTPREWIIVLKVLHLLARMQVIEQVYDADGRIRWRRVPATQNPLEE